jgi:leucyl-tRNA synthetase
MGGRTVFQPMGFDSFGINAENYSLKIGEHPASVIARTTANFRRQLSSVGNAWDWSRTLTTSEPWYYRWTQWVFVQLFRAGLAYQADAPVTWCPSCLTVLAKEQLDDERGDGIDRCERCGTAVTERVLRQWFLRITDYADRLVDGLDALDWPESAKRKQRNWIRNADGSLRLHDWLISRQRYWGSPIPIVHCTPSNRDTGCGAVAVPEDQLPVLLPEIEDFHPTGTGQSPLAAVEQWVCTTCPSCGGPARRETDVADTFVESSWYFLRYPSTDVDDRPWDDDRTARFLPVDFYAGGPEHVTRHHLYARFVTMALHDLGLVPFEEPFPHMRLGGIVHLHGSRMNKSKGNVVEPDRYVAEHGGDVLRLQLLFSGPWEENGDYRDEGIVGVERFLSRVWRLVTQGEDGTAQPAAMAAAVDKVTRSIERLRFNVGIAALMETLNVLSKHGSSAADRRTFVLLLAPFAPYVAEELWSHLGGGYSVHTQAWPGRAEAP